MHMLDTSLRAQVDIEKFEKSQLPTTDTMVNCVQVTACQGIDPWPSMVG